MPKHQALVSNPSELPYSLNALKHIFSSIASLTRKILHYSQRGYRYNASKVRTAKTVSCKASP